MQESPYPEKAPSSLPPKTPAVEPDPVLIEDEPGFMNALSLLLKRPADLFHTISEKGNGAAWGMRIATMVLLGLALFGFVMGCFSGGNQLWAVPLKLSLGVLFAAVICVPSLIIFATLGGAEAKASHLIVALIGMLGLMMLLLLGFAPVVWLFSVSSNYVSFVGCLVLIIWVISLSFGIRLLFRFLRLAGLVNSGPAQVWAVVFCLVSFQLTTTLRPLLGEYDQLLNYEEKRFFLGYWFEKLGEAPQAPRPAEDPFIDNSSREGSGR